MKILLCAATEFEIAPSRAWLERNNKISINITGVGLLAAGYSITREVLKQNPDFILQAGIAGSFDKMIPLGSVRTIRHEIIGDMGVEEKGSFHSIFALKLAEENDFPHKSGKLSANSLILEQSGIPFADAITVNEVSTAAARMEYYSLQLGAALETMEGAALHYVGLMENIPFLQLRAVSNYAGERDKSKWEMEAAIQNLNEAIINQIKIITNET